ncbi:DnaA ATPase domain-containing protein [Thalassoroseus pseudoceratinae]|uniref:DnaA ATPase domain-containing protein n=1 Tax=Thalassoroseus pseudoceratinae TaxID=2713176 RepID=UPI001421C27F|nr:DnaA/Hda family protein [Thalassoroseus pseudoceratinae]
MTPTFLTQAQPTGESFLILPENRFAWTALNRLANETGDAARMVFLEGPAGVGKSLAIRSILRQMQAADPELSVQRVTAAQWAAEFAEAAQKRSIPQFQKKYRELNVFVCEDLTGLSGRMETQQQLVSVIDELVRLDARMIFSSKSPPGGLIDFLPRLIDRWHGGIVAGVRRPSVESRERLLKHFAKLRDLSLSGEVIEEIATRCVGSPRELWGLLTQLEATARLHRQPITTDSVRRELSSDTRPPATTLSKIAKAVAKHFGVTLAGMRDTGRSAKIVRPRQCGMFLSRELTEEPLQSIAEFYGRRHHSTVLHAVKRVQNELVEEPSLRQHLDRIRTNLGVPGTA